MARASRPRSTSGASKQLSWRGPIWLVAIIGALQVAGCGDAAEEDTGSFEALCPEGGGSVVIRNDTGRPIRDLQIRGLDEGAEAESLIGDQAGLPAGGEVTWGDCSAQAQALVITFTDGSVEQSELPTLVPNTRRLTLTPGSKPVSPPPAPKPPTTPRLDPDPISTPTMVR
jgi:hypothetical protein